MDPVATLAARMALENERWGYTQIVGELAKLGHSVSRSTVRRILKERGERSDPGRAVDGAGNLIDDFSGFLREKRSLIHDRNPLFTRGFRELLQSAGVTSVWMPPRSPNLNAFAERFVLSIESERIQTAATVYPHQDSRMCGRASRCRAAITDSAAGTASSKKCKSTLNKRYHL
jgi:transposase InsO family protein